jgi:uncharacterized protein (DUF1810 family)
MSDPLARFVEAQRAMWDGALDELVAGSKRGHWMWFIFPQLRGLGFSSMAQRYAIADAGEAAAYLAHPLLGARLVEAAEALLAHRGRDIVRILGDIDAMKLRSSMTLFDRVADDDAPFADVLAAFYDGQRDDATLALLG